MSQNKDAGGHQKGPQQHAEGQHGEKTHERFLEQLAESREASDANDVDSRGISGRQGRVRLDEEQQQHGDADRSREDDRQRR